MQTLYKQGQQYLLSLAHELMVGLSRLHHTHSHTFNYADGWLITNAQERKQREFYNIDKQSSLKAQQKF